MAKDAYIQKINGMLSILNVKSIYYIDDDLIEGDAPAEVVVVPAILKELNKDKSEVLKGILPNSLLNTPKTLRHSAINTHFAGLEQAERKQLLQNVGRTLHIPTGVKPNAQSAFLSEILNKTISFKAMGPGMWSSLQDKVVEESSVENRALCFFDQRLDNQESTDNGPLSGTKLIKQLIESSEKHQKSDTIFCILFTSETDVAGEFSYWREKVADSGLQSSQFFPLAKERVKDNRLFAEGLKLSSLNALYDVLRVQTQTLLDTATGSAVKELNTIHLYNLNFMVGLTSKEEGVWEASTLLRLHEILRNEHVRKQMIKDSYASEFNKNIDKVAEINRVFPYLPEFDSSERYQLRHRELYEDGKTVNGIYTELRTGDIFRDTIAAQDFILIAQPCDMVVRTTGERKSAVVTIVPISVFTKDEYAAKIKEKPNFAKTCFILEYYNSSTNDVGCVGFNSSFSVEVDVLDLAVLNADGKCHIDFGRDLTLPPSDLPSAWKKRFLTLRDTFQQTHDNLKLIQEELEKVPKVKDLVLSLLPASYRAMTSKPEIKGTKPSVTKTTLDYHLQRISSVRLPISGYLLDAYTKYMSRVAYDHDFSIVKPETEASFSEKRELPVV